MVYDVGHPLQSALTCNSTKILSLASKLYELQSKGISNDLTCPPVLWYILSTFMKCDSNRSDMSPWYEMFLKLFWNALKWSDMPLPTHALEMFFQLFWNALKWWCDMQWGEASVGKVSFSLWPWWVRSGNVFNSQPPLLFPLQVQHGTGYPRGSCRAYIRKHFI